jgi:uncharacterized membrane protein YphA (DoxX/SURF4 family)
MEIDKYRKVLLNTARVILGLCFVFSGFAKAVDPLGTMYKINDYLEAFGMVYLTDLSFLMSVSLSAAEFFLGMALLLGVWKRSVTLLLLVFMLFLTPLTLYIAIKNPVTDCGCFGDVLVLSNTVTFIKNLFLLALAIFVFYRNDLLVTFLGRRTGRWSAFWCLFFPLLLSSYSYLHLPLLDFLPYKIGNHLADLMNVPEGAATDSFSTVFIYENNGVQKEFTVDNAPLNDPNWKYIDRKDVLIRDGFKPLIHDFVLEHPTQGDITDRVLNDTSYTFLFVSSKLEESNTSTILGVLDARKYAKKYGYRFYGLTSSNIRETEDWKYEFDADFDFCSVDDRTLKTMIRSNPGLILLKNGTVLQKWGFRDIPDFTEKNQPLSRLKWGETHAMSDWRVVGNLFLLLIAPLIFFFLMHSGYRFHFRLHRNNAKAND